jgi:hypothetical protein
VLSGFAASVNVSSTCLASRLLHVFPRIDSSCESQVPIYMCQCMPYHVEVGGQTGRVEYYRTSTSRSTVSLRNGCLRDGPFSGGMPMLSSPGGSKRKFACPCPTHLEPVRSSGFVYSLGWAHPASRVACMYRVKSDRAQGSETSDIFIVIPAIRHRADRHRAAATDVSHHTTPTEASEDAAGSKRNFAF